MDDILKIQEEQATEIPKPELEEQKAKTNVWIKSLSSLALYLIIGFFFFDKNWILVLIYKDLGIFFIPLMGAYVSGKKQEVSQQQSAVILLAGPVPGIILGTILHFIALHYEIKILEVTATILVYLNLLNLFPVYPLDGGQLLYRLFLDETNIFGKIFVVISAAILSYFAIKISFYPLLLFPALMISRMIGDIQHERIVSKIEAEGVDLIKTYDELSVEEYWKVRNVIIRHYSNLKDVPPSPPYLISPKEDQVIMAIQNLLQRSITQDLSLAEKIIILIVWLGCFAVPVLLNLHLRFY
jgi:Zn-dependent protease